MRFTETEAGTEAETETVSQESHDNPDGIDINIKFNDENKNFLFVINVF